jgi:hypothetical protein
LGVEPYQAIGDPQEVEVSMTSFIFIIGFFLPPLSPVAVFYCPSFSHSLSIPSSRRPTPPDPERETPAEA